MISFNNKRKLILIISVLVSINVALMNYIIIIIFLLIKIIQLFSFSCYFTIIAKKNLFVRKTNNNNEKPNIYIYRPINSIRPNQWLINNCFKLV